MDFKKNVEIIAELTGKILHVVDVVISNDTQSSEDSITQYTDRLCCIVVKETKILFNLALIQKLNF